MANFADNFTTLCDRLSTILAIIKEDKPFSKKGANKKGVQTTAKSADGKVYNFSEDINEIKLIAERIELRLFKYMATLEEVTQGIDAMANRLITLRLEAPNSMMVHKEDTVDGIKTGPKTHYQPDFKQQEEGQKKPNDNRRGRPRAELVVLREPEAERPAVVRADNK